MLDDILTITFLVSLLSGMLRIAAPIMFAALGELITERSGILNLGVEGTMLMGAFVGFLATYQSGSLWFGVLAALLAGGAMGLLMAFMSSSLKVDQTVTGLALNIFANGLAFYGYRVAFKQFVSENLPTVRTFRPVPIPVLSRIPVLGETLFTQHTLTYMALVMVPVIYFFLYRTKFGLELRCLGENPRAVDMRGINIHLYQYLAVIFGGMMAGLGGAFLTLASAGLFVPDIAAGRGWIAIAIVIFGGWKPFRILAAALFFGLLDSFQLQVQGVGIQFPYQLLLALPYVLTIVALVVSRNRQGAPLSLGIPYTRE
jgi:simple sugar transport system permease protein